MTTLVEINRLQTCLTTVANLIEELKKLPQDAVVFTNQNWGDMSENRPVRLPLQSEDSMVYLDMYEKGWMLTDSLDDTEDVKKYVKCVRQCKVVVLEAQHRSDIDKCLERSPCEEE